jgi:5-bromo-4-chloroindolyl phosphate hydrolysis protein
MNQLEQKLLETLVGLEEIKHVIKEALEELKEKHQCPVCQISKKKKEKKHRTPRNTSLGT